MTNGGRRDVVGNLRGAENQEPVSIYSLIVLFLRFALGLVWFNSASLFSIGHCCRRRCF